MIISNDNDSLIFDMHIMMKMIPRYYHFIITQISIKYPNIKSQTNNILSRYFDKPQYCTLVKSSRIVRSVFFPDMGFMDETIMQLSSDVFFPIGNPHIIRILEKIQKKISQSICLTVKQDYPVTRGHY